jgi:hypothetical protein
VFVNGRSVDRPTTGDRDELNRPFPITPGWRAAGGWPSRTVTMPMLQPHIPTIYLDAAASGSLTRSSFSLCQGGTE